MKLKIAVNKNCKNKTNPQKVAKGWLNIYEDVEWLEGWVKAGYGWTATHFVTSTVKLRTAAVATSLSLTLMVTQHLQVSGRQTLHALGVLLPIHL